MYTFVAGGRTVCVFPAAELDAPVVYLNTFGEEGRKVLDALAAACRRHYPNSLCPARHRVPQELCAAGYHPVIVGGEPLVQHIQLRDAPVLLGRQVLHRHR